MAEPKLVIGQFMKKIQYDNRAPAFVLGMFETGLGVARSLGQAGIKVFGVDHKKDIAWYSRYVEGRICPHPLEREQEFIAFLLEISREISSKPVLFITSDIFLTAISKNREVLESFFKFNLAGKDLLSKIANKYDQFRLATEAGTPVPQTIVLSGRDQIDEISQRLPYPVIIKGLDVNSWRKVVSSSVKGFAASDKEIFLRICDPILSKNVPVVVQEIISGPDTNHFKYCAYYSPDKKRVCEFTLRKIRQNPIHFGVGSVVESVVYDDLKQAGRKLFQSIGYQGVGSAEFKIDAKDGQLKLIEINPRYWQQNFLATVCGINFPLLDYLTMTDQPVFSVSTFKTGIKWVNCYLDFESFLQYRKEKSLTFMQWRRSLKGKKVFSDFVWDDMLPAGWEIRFGLRLLRFPLFLFKRLFKHGK